MENWIYTIYENFRFEVRDESIHAQVETSKHDCSGWRGNTRNIKSIKLRLQCIP